MYKGPAMGGSAALGIIDPVVEVACICPGWMSRTGNVGKMAPRRSSTISMAAFFVIICLVSLLLFLPGASFGLWWL